MNPAVFDDALILTGPTASGKSAVGLTLAERLGAEIVSMDSMALYRGMDIGTAKPSRSERKRMPHHLIDVLEPWESASLAWWLREAALCCRDIVERGRRVLFVGGTPLYLKGLLHGIFEGPAGDPELRSQLEARSGEDLHAELRERDPVAAVRLHPNDLRRLVRALEVMALTGKPISEWQEQFKQVRPRPHAPIWLDLPRDVLYARIDTRVRQMIQTGLVEEVRRLLALPQTLSKEARQGLGYKEIIEYLERSGALAETVIRIQTRSRQFAKRQLTWFRNLPECQRLPVAEHETPEQIADRVLAQWR